MASAVLSVPLRLFSFVLPSRVIPERVREKSSRSVESPPTPVAPPEIPTIVQAIQPDAEQSHTLCSRVPAKQNHCVEPRFSALVKLVNTTIAIICGRDDVKPFRAVPRCSIQVSVVSFPKEWDQRVERRLECVSVLSTRRSFLFHARFTGPETSAFAEGPSASERSSSSRTGSLSSACSGGPLYHQGRIPETAAARCSDTQVFQCPAPHQQQRAIGCKRSDRNLDNSPLTYVFRRYLNPFSSLPPSR